MKERSDHTVKSSLDCGRRGTVRGSYGRDAERKEVEPAACYARESSVQKPHTQLPREHAALTLEGS